MEKKKSILVASNNKGKIKEIKDIFNDFNIITLQEMETKLNKKLEVNEEANTFKENALQKVTELVNQLNENIIVMGDDSGLSIDALDGFPGIHTNRWMDADDHTKNLALIEKMKGVPDQLRSCKYTTAIAIADKNMTNVVEYSLYGYIAKTPVGANGFGFDEIFALDNGKTLAELTSEEKYEISPRKKALEEMRKNIDRMMENRRYKRDYEQIEVKTIKENDNYNKIFVQVLEQEKAILKYPKCNIEVKAYIGRNGITEQKQEGDGKTPLGEFQLGVILGTEIGIQNKNGLEHKKITKGMYWVDDSNSKYYNQLVDENKVEKDWNSAEHLIEYPIEYKYLVEIKTNPENISGKGSAVFLHCSNNKPTAGCIAIDSNSMRTIIENIDENTKIEIKREV